MLTGVAEVGLFCQMARAAYFGNLLCSFCLVSNSGIPIDYCGSSVGWKLNREMG